MPKPVIECIPFELSQLVFVFFFNFFVCLGVELINNVVIVSGGQRRDPAICVRVSILSQAPLPSRLPRNIEQSSLYYTGGPCWLSILNIAVCICYKHCF